MSDFARQLAVEQRKRLVGSLMDHLEKRVYPHIPQDERKALRDKVMSSVGVYHDFVIDCLKATVGGDAVVNEEALRLIGEIHTAVRARG